MVNYVIIFNLTESYELDEIDLFPLYSKYREKDGWLYIKFLFE